MTLALLLFLLLLAVLLGRFVGVLLLLLQGRTMRWGAFVEFRWFVRYSPQEETTVASARTAPAADSSVCRRLLPPPPLKMAMPVALQLQHHQHHDYWCLLFDRGQGRAVKQRPRDGRVQRRCLLGILQR